MFRSLIITLFMPVLAVVLLPAIGSAAYVEAAEITIQINGESGDEAVLVDFLSEEVITQSNSVNIDNTITANAQSGNNEIANGASAGVSTGHAAVSTSIQQDFNINSSIINCPCEVSDREIGNSSDDLSIGLRSGESQYQEGNYQPISKSNISDVSNSDSYAPYEMDNSKSNLGISKPGVIDQNLLEILGLGFIDLPTEHNATSNESVPAVPYSTANLPLLLNLVFGNSNSGPKMFGLISSLFTSSYFSLVFLMIFTFCTILLTSGFLRFSSGVSPPENKLIYAQY